MGRLRIAALGLCAAAALAAQDSEPVFRSDVRLVRLLVTVKNAQDRPVGGLEQTDFAITDSGVPQQIAAFERYTSQPLSIALLVDTSGSTARELKSETEAISKFLRAVTKEGNPDDALSFYSFNQDVTQQTGYTRNPRTIERRASNLIADAGTSLYDAMTLAAEPLARREGRHVIILITDGGDTTSVRTYQDALRALHAADAILFPIVVTPIRSQAGRNVGGENALTTLAESTGGRTFLADKALADSTKSLDDVFAEILRDLRTQYLLAYYPKDLPPADSPFRRIRVAVAKPGLRASTRGGYYEK